MDWNETPAELARAWAEQPVIMPGQHGDLYGIFTPPAPEASPAGLCVILFGRNRWRATAYRSRVQDGWRPGVFPVCALTTMVLEKAKEFVRLITWR